MHHIERVSSPCFRPPVSHRRRAVAIGANSGFGLAFLALSTLVLTSDARALGFEYALDDFELTGNLEFYDDFEDGLRDSPPTSEIVDWLTTVSVEQDGFLILDSDNGFIPRPDLGDRWIQGLVEHSTALPDGGSGNSTFAVSVRPDAIGQWPNHYAITLEEYPTRGGIELGVRRFARGILEIFFYDNETGARLATDFFQRSSVSGNIVLEMVVNHATDTVVPRYSVDGGANFKEWTDWTSAFAPGAIYVTQDEVDANFSAFGVPEPGTAVLLLTALVGLASRRAHRP